ncbi:MULTISPECIES: formate--tetrahydrofolate ligase [Halolamina]|uniref:Formate--tetrahydrofolate ligase n=1 Tax=Halolamina pelagica TaxID=699431 RepID=A0A1I5TPS5_9EURY|nr:MULTISPECIES: formate--tetrahydrofolate ligase [Halolamina]NHX37756.1 formate--tetrahydrofolate ligase [Halolamina sp. R1-12]SFP84911.1 Formate-tetrahydrofolate ligase [Halolamina pelagica]
MDSDTEAIPADIDIARNAERRAIESVGADLGLAAADLERRGNEVAKLTWDAIHREMDQPADGNLVLVTAMTPTRRGAGKTVTTVGLGQAFGRLDERSVVAIREPSLGPVFGIKGGAAGGGYSQVLPMEEINLHFTGDIHAVTSAHNLVSAMVDAHRHHGNELGIDPDRVVWPRVLDMNDRALRETVAGLGGTASGPPREDGFSITAASELMAVLCLATDVSDLRERVSRIIVAYDTDGDPVTVADLDVAGSVASLLKDALRPNLVQTIEGTPAFVHGGPFANIATGTNSILADKLGLRLGDYVVTEAGFGADLGAEKFVDVVSREGVEPDATVIVATVDALQKHGGIEDDESDPMAALRAGFANLDHHVEVLQSMGLPVVVAVNRFPDDSDAEIREVLDHCEEQNVPAAVSTVHADGGAGGTDVARLVKGEVESGDGELQRVYDLDASLPEKIRAVATRVYGADDVEFTSGARDDIERIEAQGLDDMPVCISKTPSSLSDDPGKIGVPEDWTLTVTELSPSAGAGFVVVLTGDVLTMPGLPSDPAAAHIDIDEDGSIHGLF